MRFRAGENAGAAGGAGLASGAPGVRESATPRRRSAAGVTGGVSDRDTQGIASLGERIPEILEDGENGLPATTAVFAGLLEHLQDLDQRMAD